MDHTLKIRSDTSIKRTMFFSHPFLHVLLIVTVGLLAYYDDIQCSLSVG